MALLDPLYALPRTQKVIIGLVPLVAIGALGWFLLLDPTIQERDGLQQRHEALRAEVIKARADEANLRPFRAQAEALRRRLEVARQRLPDEKEIPGLYRTLTDLAFQAGLAVALFQPRNPEDRAAYSEVPIGVTVEGTYHQVGEFFERVGRLPRLVTLGDFRMAGIERPTGTLRGEMTMATYIYRPEAAPRPGAPARPGTPPARGPR
jgi:type IV pilus assembly protein PilO